jgi:hypothetical protein
MTHLNYVTRISEWIGVPLDYLKINNKRQAITDHVISNANCLYSSFITSGADLTLEEFEDTKV